jgi:hypothetical protein
MNYRMQGQEVCMTRFEKVVLALMILQVALQLLSIYTKQIDIKISSWPLALILCGGVLWRRVCFYPPR